MVKTFCVASSNDLGNISSTDLELQFFVVLTIFKSFQVTKMEAHPRSFEKRLRILPEGLSSKKRIVVEIIPLNIVL